MGNEKEEVGFLRFVYEIKRPGLNEVEAILVLLFLVRGVPSLTRLAMLVL